MIRRLLLATLNPGKLHELAEALRAVGVETCGLDSLPGRREAEVEVEETGDTFEENAKLKAEAASRKTNLPVLADDSGLEVDALGGAPGIRSARWGCAALDDAGRNRKLVESLRGVPTERRTARFRCVLAVASGGHTAATFAGVVEGRILEEPRGANGFGYDPLFFHPPTGGSFAELTRVEKERWSHRGQAIAAFVAALREGDPRLAGLG